MTVARPTASASTRPIPSSRSPTRSWARAAGLIPAGTQTLAKGPGQFVRGVAPEVPARAGEGAHVWDVDGNEYLDFSMAVGPLSLGYAYPAVDAAIRAQLEDGITFSLMHPLEVEVAELVREVVPGRGERALQQDRGRRDERGGAPGPRLHRPRARCSAAATTAGTTGTSRSPTAPRGVPEAVRELTFTFAYNDLDAAREAIDDDTACVILEPATFEAPKPGFLEGLREACDERGAPCSSSTRCGRASASPWAAPRSASGSPPTWPASPRRSPTACRSRVLTGRARRDGPAREATSSSSRPSAARRSRWPRREATIEEMRESRTCPPTSRAWGRQAQGGLQRARRRARPGLHALRRLRLPHARHLRRAGGRPARVKSFVQQELIRRGILWGGFHNLSFSHTDADVDHTLARLPRGAAPPRGGAWPRATSRARLRGRARGAGVPADHRASTPGPAAGGDEGSSWRAVPSPSTGGWRW